MITKTQERRERRVKCPVCDNENPSMLCRKCGFDSSRDYSKYPTFGPVGRVPSVSALRKQWQEKQKPAKPEKRAEPERITKPVAPPKPAPPTNPPRQTTSSIPVKPPVHTTVNPPAAGPVPKNKWIAFLLCLFFGLYGGHKFYEGKKGMGILYLCTFGLWGYGWLFDCIMLLFKPNPYYPSSGKPRR